MASYRSNHRTQPNDDEDSSENSANALDCKEPNAKGSSSQNVTNNSRKKNRRRNYRRRHFRKSSDVSTPCTNKLDDQKRTAPNSKSVMPMSSSNSDAEGSPTPVSGYSKCSAPRRQRANAHNTSPTRICVCEPKPHNSSTRPISIFGESSHNPPSRPMFMSEPNPPNPPPRPMFMVVPNPHERPSRPMYMSEPNLPNPPPRPMFMVVPNPHEPPSRPMYMSGPNLPNPPPRPVFMSDVLNQPNPHNPPPRPIFFSGQNSHNTPQRPISISVETPLYLEPPVPYVSNNLLQTCNNYPRPSLPGAYDPQSERRAPFTERNITRPSLYNFPEPAASKGFHSNVAQAFNQKPVPVGYDPHPQTRAPLPEQLHSSFISNDGQIHRIKIPAEDMLTPWLPRSIKCINLMDTRESACSLSLSNPFRFVYTGGKCVKIWDLIGSDYRQPISILNSSESAGCICSMKLLPDGRTLVVGGESSNIFSWDLASPSPRIKAILPLHGDACCALTISPDSKFCYSCCTDGVICVWDLHNNKNIGGFGGHTDHITALECSPDGNTLWSGSADCTVRNWDLRTGRLLKALNFTSSVLSLAVCPLGSWFAVAQENSDIEVPHTTTLHRFLLRLHKSPVLNVKFAASGRWFVSTGTDKSLNIWKTPHGTCLIQDRVPSMITCCDISADDSYFVTVSSDASVRVYQISY